MRLKLFLLAALSSLGISNGGLSQEMQTAAAEPQGDLILNEWTQEEIDAFVQVWTNIKTGDFESNNIQEVGQGLSANAELWRRAADALPEDGAVEIRDLRNELEERANISELLAGRIDRIEQSIQLEPGDMIEVARLRGEIASLDKRLDGQSDNIERRLGSVESSVNVLADRFFSFFVGTVIALVVGLIGLLVGVLIQNRESGNPT